MNDLKEWYNNLYRGEKILVKIGIAIFIGILLLWITHAPKERDGVKKPIIIYSPIRS